MFEWDLKIFTDIGVEIFLGIHTAENLYKFRIFFGLLVLFRTFTILSKTSLYIFSL